MTASAKLHRDCSRTQIHASGCENVHIGLQVCQLEGRVAAASAQQQNDHVRARKYESLSVQKSMECAALAIKVCQYVYLG